MHPVGRGEVQLVGQTVSRSDHAEGPETSVHALAVAVAGMTALTRSADRRRRA
jgi:hypothetical protein